VDNYVSDRAIFLVASRTARAKRGKSDCRIAKNRLRRAARPHIGVWDAAHETGIGLPRSVVLHTMKYNF
jgi:hypothetical protein